jgi:hypothetical protein
MAAEILPLTLSWILRAASKSPEENDAASELQLILTAARQHPQGAWAVKHSQ